MKKERVRINTDGKQYAVFLDIDGTLMGTSDEALQRNLDVIKKVRSLGHKVFVNTGRSSGYMPKKIDLKANFDGVISGAGARIIVDDKEIFSQMIPVPLVKQFCRYSIEKGIFGILEGVEKMFYTGEYYGEYQPEEADWVRFDADNLDEIVTEDALIEKFTVLGQVPKDVTDRLDGDCFLLQHSSYAEIIVGGCSKSRAMHLAMDFLKIPYGQSVAMGDSMNDFDMIEKAGIGVAMGNAVPEIKNIADMITEDVNSAGVAAALEKIFSL